MTISVGGLVTGLDTQSIIDALVQAERIPIDRLQIRRSGFQNQVSALQKLNTLVKAVQDAADALQETSDPLLGRTAVATSAGAVAVSVTNTTPAGSYTVDVTQLARAQTLTTAASAFADTDTTAVGTGTLAIQIGSGPAVDITIDSTNNTLAGVRDAINDANAGVTAAIVNDGSASPYRLVITANTTGTANAATLSVTGDGDANDTDNAGLSRLINANLTETQAALDAQLTVSGIAITSATNTVTDAIPGATIDLVGTSGTTPTTVTVKEATGPLETKLSTFVDAFNAIAQFNAAHNNVNQPGVLAGDFTLRSVVSRLNSTVLSLGHGSGSIQSLSALGVRMTNGGSLSFDASVLRGAIETDKATVEEVIRGDGTTTHGVFGQIATAVEAFTDPITGAIHGRTEGLGANVKRINQQITTSEARIDAYKQQVTKQYAQLELLVNNLKTQGDSLLQALSNLPAIRTGK
ncbi:MAG: hypothetical protein COW73_04660 [Nitrospirae bacterium CG18_big_fil_WC_8_21_14_2_50_70_55]|nr:flagellar filament capping protein FliD [Deltaproteobacteria bacterium]OIP62897.1 MAG: hypothetical protein AUK30_09390 [Nitrospirae bacterium CG2_30_70_394]PIQ05792.1 MAG: hypothetical protein COW73_04660 [Nitrospirae bacterium CG18_big_fil_WC_8_21_14_2_50_70_55]PIU78611.1 MAG: hypothetical protein COS73_06685 [Nitrospirae bacterium CG06_land_8_20_14_3_00_70_43]PIW82478.1 MAG: hypothetical protein COZ96_08470 [Nitrospirae bacterium CG_4_8_14_3_um_filter_70_85]PIX82440.1 MAG: hypothetical p